MIKKKTIEVTVTCCDICERPTRRKLLDYLWWSNDSFTKPRFCNIHKGYEWLLLNLEKVEESSEELRNLAKSIISFAHTRWEQKHGAQAD